MAVSPVRALLEAQFQATWNRSRRELGTLGRIVYGLFLALATLLGAVPVLGVSLVGGWYLGQRLVNPETARLLGALLGTVALLGGVAGGIAGGSRVLAWEATRIFPLKLRSLFLAELVAGLGDLLPLVIALSSGCLLLGVGAARPRLLPLLPLSWLGTVGGLLCAQYLVNSLAARIVKRLQAGLVVLALLAWAGLTLLPFSDRALPAFVLLERAAPALRGLSTAALAIPPLGAAEGLRQAALGHWGVALALQLWPMAFLFLLLLAAARLLNREADPQTLRPATRGRERLWTFRTPVEGVARLHWRTIISSHLGRFGFLVPLMVLVILRGPAAHSRAAALWSLPGAVSYLALSGVQMQLNQFGLDGPGVKALLLLPLRARDLLAGKALGLLAYLGCQTLLLLLILALTGRLAPGQVLPALCLSGCLFLYQVGLGHWTSAWLPRPMPRDSLKNHNVAPAVIWLGMAATLAGALVFGGAWLVTAWLAPAWLLPVMAALLAGMACLYWLAVLPMAAEYLDGRREVLVQALGRAG